MSKKLCETCNGIIGWDGYTAPEDRGHRVGCSEDPDPKTTEYIAELRKELIKAQNVKPAVIALGTIHPAATVIPMRLPCPACGELHIDVGEFATKIHHTHACRHCGMVWRPAIVPTVGVRFLPGFKNEEEAT